MAVESNGTGLPNGGRIIGSLHDIGKNNPKSQQRFFAEHTGHADYKGTGAALFEALGSPFYRMGAYSAAGHHGGLPGKGFPRPRPVHPDRAHRGPPMFPCLLVRPLKAGSVAFFVKAFKFVEDLFDRFLAAQACIKQDATSINEAEEPIITRMKPTIFHGLAGVTEEIAAQFDRRQCPCLI